MRVLLGAFCLLIGTIVAAAPANAGPVLERVKTRGAVRCGAFERPGLASDVDPREAADAENRGQEPAETPWHGLHVEICRAVATAVLGAPAKIQFHDYAGPDDLAGLAAGDDDIAFLTAREMHMAGITGRVVPGPVVYIESLAAMLPAATGVKHLNDIDGMKGVCFASGSALEHVLPDYFARVKKPWLPVAFTEDGEMIDAYHVGHCQVLAGERSTLAADALQGGVNALQSTILPEPLATTPIMATTGIGDGQWSAIVAWTVATLMAGDRPSTSWAVGGAASMPVDMGGSDGSAGGNTGLGRDWQARVLKAVGSYGQILDRSEGAHSALHLPPGLNASVGQGGALVAPGFE
jgi:general L-amino acid transport system substrate-binding protein